VNTEKVLRFSLTELSGKTKNAVGLSALFLFLYSLFYFFAIMAANKRIDALSEQFKPAIEALGCALWGIEYLAQGKHSILRVFIDTEHGVSVEDCARVSHQLSGILDVEDPISGEYHLEVSSPGLDRLLFSLSQFERYVGEQIQLRLSHANNGRRNFSAHLDAVTGDTLQLRVDNEVFEVPYALVEKARLVPQF
jgi:ribosome maturation factor RimP